jgi:peptide/nickel transport system substrate-binding protein
LRLPMMRFSGLVLFAGLFALFDSSRAAALGPRYGGQLRIGADASADSLMPIYAVGEGSALDAKFLYDSLVNVDPNFKVVPWLASSWTISKDGLTYTFHLRKNAKWSDGVPITADDQVFEYELTTNPATAAPSKADYDPVSKVSAPNRYTVIYKLHEPNGAFLATVIAQPWHAPLPRHVYRAFAPGQLKAAGASSRLVVSGSYTLTDWVRDDHVLLSSNHEWWHGRPLIDQIYIKEYQSDDAVLIALQRGDVDTAYALNAAMWAALKDDPRYAKVHRPGNLFNQFLPNMKNPILADVQVRRAIMYAWDRKTEAARLFHGEAVAALSPIPWAQRWAFDPATERAYPYDPKKAADILDRDGWRLDPDGLRRKNGRTLRFVTSVPAGSGPVGSVFAFFQENLRAVGIETEPRTLEFNVFNEKESEGEFDMDAEGFQGNPDPDPYLVLSSKAMPPGGQNNGRYASSEMDRLIDEARRESDPGKRARIYKKLQALFVDRVPILVDAMEYYRNVMSKRIGGFDPAKSGSQFPSLMFSEPSWYVVR